MSVCTNLCKKSSPIADKQNDRLVWKEDVVYTDLRRPWQTESKTWTHTSQMSSRSVVTIPFQNHFLSNLESWEHRKWWIPDIIMYRVFQKWWYLSIHSFIFWIEKIKFHFVLYIFFQKLTNKNWKEKEKEKKPVGGLLEHTVVYNLILSIFHTMSSASEISRSKFSLILYCVYCVHCVYCVYFLYCVHCVYCVLCVLCIPTVCTVCTVRRVKKEEDKQ